MAVDHRHPPPYIARMTPTMTIDSGSSRLLLQGDWTLEHYTLLTRDTNSHSRSVSSSITTLDATGLSAMDTAGAALLLRMLGAEQLNALIPTATGLSAERQALLLAVATAMTGRESETAPPRKRPGDGLATLGKLVVSGWHELAQFLNFLGLTLLTLVRLLPRPWRWRPTALVAQMHQTGLNAVPIIFLLNFLVGCVVAFLGATVLANFGATIYTVDLVGYAFMRELGVLLAAILLAGRTASAFTAQIGSMKVNEELDALSVQGLSPIELLVLPRLLALLIMLPVLSFIAVLAGILGGALVSVLTLDVSFARFLGIVQEIPLRHILLGLAKAPFFALVIALIGCLEGFKVQGSAQSVGEHTTSAVVQSIFAVILLDAVAALFYMEMGW